MTRTPDTYAATAPSLKQLVEALVYDELRKHRLEWADYIEHREASVGVPPLTTSQIVALLRSPRPPFGAMDGGAR